MTNGTAAGTHEIIDIGVTSNLAVFHNDVRQAIAIRIIELATAGERNPDVLCEQALAAIRWQE